MTVKELVEVLSFLPDQSTVHISAGGREGDAKEVVIRFDEGGRSILVSDGETLDES